MPLDPRIDALLRSTPGGNDQADLADLRRLVAGADRNSLVVASLPPFRFVGVEVGWSNGFGNYGNGYASVGYRRGADGYVDLEGLATKAAGAVQNELIFTLPADCRPVSQHMHSTSVAAGGQSNLGYVIVSTNGEVRASYANALAGLSPVNYVALDEIRFRTA